MADAQDGVWTITAADGVALKVGAFPAEGDGPAVVLVHGIASHMGWYRDLARALSRRGLSVYTPDRRGSGISGGPRGHLARWRVGLDDLIAVCGAVEARHPGRPLHLYGISLGAVFAAAAALERPGRFASLFMTSPGFAGRQHVPLRRKLRLLRRSIVDPGHMYTLPFGAADLTARPDWQARLQSDALRTRRVSARFLVETFRLQGRTRRRLARLRTPVLALLAGDDAIVDNEATLAALRRAERAAVRVELHEGASHVLPATLPREALVARMETWFRDESASAPAGWELRRVQPASGDLPAPPGPAST